MFKLKKACVHCPFSKAATTARGCISEYRAREIINSLKEGKVFICHKTTTAEQTEDQEGVSVPLDRRNNFCFGALTLVETSGIVSKAVITGHILGLYKRDQFVPDPNAFRSSEEFIKWHSQV